MYKYVVFDLDGTLVDTDFMIALTMYELYRKYRPDFKPRLEDMLLFSGPPLWKTMQSQFPGCDVEKMKQEFLKTSISYYENTAVAYPGARDFLLYIRNRGIKTGLFTSKLRKAVDLTLRLTDLDGLFDATISGDEVSRNKPDPEGLSKIMEKLGCADKNELLYVGDSAYDEECARRADVDIALSKFARRELLEDTNPNYTFKSYEELRDGLQGKI